MFHIVLFEPEIPHNTGNVIRLCANAGCQLHLIEPLGFSLENTRLKRAGLDYHHLTRVHVHSSWACFYQKNLSLPFFIFSTKAQKKYHEMNYLPHSVLVFGPETRGLPPQLITEFSEKGQAARIPMSPNSRSINLSNAVAITLYEAWRQNGFNLSEESI